MANNQATSNERQAQALSTSILSLLQRLPASSFPYANIASNTVSGNSLGAGGSSGISAFAGLVPVSEPSVTAASSSTSFSRVIVPQKEVSSLLSSLCTKLINHACHYNV